jgi:hypothetical protein
MMAEIAQSRRVHDRFTLLGSLPGAFKIAEQILEVLPVDVSEGGLGLLIDPSPSPGEMVEWCNPPTDNIKLEVIWSIKAEASQAFSEFDKMRRCGLILEDKTINLVDICKEQDGLQIVE